MAMIETWLRQNLRQPVVVHRLDGNLFSGDNQGNKIGVIVTDNNETVDLDDSCFGYFIRSDGATIPIEGTASGNTAYVVLPASCYVCIGQFSFVLKVGTTTLAACTGYIYRTSTDTIVDPGSVVPSLSELLDKISDCETATAEAENVNISHTKVGPVITITTTDRDGQTEESTIREPTISVTKHGTEDPVPSREGDFDITVISSNGTEVVTNTITIPNPNAELSDRAHIGSISRSKTRTGNPIQIEDAVNEIADKTVIKLVPKQDLHGYGKPWVAGAGKNKCSVDNVSLERTNSRTANLAIDSIPAGNYILSWKISGTSSHALVRFRNAADNTTVSSPGDTELVSATTTANITLTDTAGRIYFYIDSAQEAGKTAVISEFMLRPAGTEAGFEPYENICPISGYDTVNVYDCGTNLVVTDKIKAINSTAENVRNGLEFTKLGQYTVSGKATASTAIYARIVSATGVYGTYSVIVNATTGATVTYTVQEGEKLIVFDASESTVSASKDKFVASCVQVEFGSTGTEYAEPGVAYPIAVSLAANGNQTAGTVYSGTVTLLADGSGQVVVDRKQITMDGVTDGKKVTNAGSHQEADQSYNFYQPLSDGYLFGKTSAVWLTRDEMLANGMMFSHGSIAVSADNVSLMCYIGANGTVMQPRFTFRNEVGITTVENCNAWFAAQNTAGTPVQMTYPLKTPLVYTLTANQVQTLLGYNYIYTDGTEIALTYRQESLATNETLLKLLPTGTATGNPVTFSDGADGVPLKQLVVNVEPVQEGSGTPSPTNVRPIRGWDSVPLLQTGKNLIAITATSGTVSNVAVTVNDDGTVKLNGTANADGTITLASGISTKGGEEYWLDGCPSEGVYNSTYWLNYFGEGVDEDGDGVYLIFNSSGGLSGGIAASEPDLTGTVSIKFKNGTVFNNVVFSPMLYNTSLSRDFEPGVKKTYSIALPSEAGTVYGGTITLDENGEGELRVNKKYVDMGSVNWSQHATRKYAFTYDFSDSLLGVLESEDLKSSIFPYDNSVSFTFSAASTFDDNTMYRNAGASNVYIKCTRFEAQTATEFKEFVTGQQLVYKLTTPVVYPMTADQVKTLLGTNIISSDAGNIEVTYFADICKKIEALIRSNP